MLRPMWFNKPATITLRTNLSVAECLRQLRDETDAAQRTIFALSGYRGSKTVLCTFDGAEFRLRKRRYYNNSFAPIFFGTLEPQSRGTLVRGYFDMDPWTKLFMKVWLGGVILISAFVLSSARGTHQRRQMGRLGGATSVNFLGRRFSA